MNRGALAGLGAAALIVAWALGWALWPAPAPERADAPAPTHATYAVFHHGRVDYGDPATPGLALGGETTLDGRITLRRVARDRLVLRVDALDALEVTVAGRSVVGPDDAAQIVGQQAVLRLAADGGAEAAAFAPDASPLLRNLVRLVMLETLTRRRDDVRVEATQLGRARTRWATTGDDVARTREAYVEVPGLAPGLPGATQALQASATATLGDDGLWATFEGRESLTVTQGGQARVAAESETRLTRIDAAAEPPSATPTVDAPVALTDPAARADDSAQHLAQRIGDLTAEALLERLDAFPGGRLPDHARFLWQATGLLRAEPSLCGLLAARLVEPGRPPGGRALLADLLAGAGTSAAQAALRTALADPGLAAAPDYPALYQRVALLNDPDEATAAWALTHHRAPGPEGAEAAALTLGAVAGKALRQRGDDALARGLLADALAAKAPADRARLLTALGNAGDPRSLAPLRPFAADPDASVRRAWTAAVRRLADDPDTRARLIDLTGDGAGAVQQGALDTLARGGLRAADLPGLTTQVRAGALSEAGLPRLLDLAAPLLPDPGAEALVRAVLDRDLQDVGIRARARDLLARAAR